MNLKPLAIAGILSFSLVGCLENLEPAKTSLQSDKDRYSYALGASFGKQVQSQLIARDSLDVDIKVFLQAFKEYYNLDSAKYLMNDSTIFATLNELSQKAQAERVKRDSIASAKAIADEQAFLEKNKTQEGVITTASGLQYKVVQKAEGVQPNDSSIVKVHYTGTLLNGKEFDSSVKRGQPLEFPIGAVIPGWTEVLKLMHAGEKVTAWIPSKLGYGARNMGVIPPNSMLVFEIELIEVKSPTDVAQSAAAAQKTAPAAEAKKAAAK